MSVIAFIAANKFVIVCFLFSLSEVLALIPKVKANSVFQAISNGLKSLKEKLDPKAQ